MVCFGGGKKKRKEARLADIEMKIHDAEVAILNTNQKVGELNDNIKHAMMENAKRLDILEDTLLMGENGSTVIADLQDKLEDASQKMAALEANQAKNKKSMDKELDGIHDFMDAFENRDKKTVNESMATFATARTAAPKEKDVDVAADKPIPCTSRGMAWCDGYPHGNPLCDRMCDPTIPTKVDSLEMEKQLLLRQLHQSHHLFHQRDDMRNDLIVFREEINRLLNTLSLPKR
eukprot:GEMP01029476.1.p1 GENE.GEMP01029476.1~~GEMP01029476.1.p1  ORF type:complete len:233 (+),score=52.70 GEMP01029476.1:152-850(+)